jgi:hypothetical protein
MELKAWVILLVAQLVPLMYMPLDQLAAMVVVMVVGMVVATALDQLVAMVVVTVLGGMVRILLVRMLVHTEPFQHIHPKHTHHKKRRHVQVLIHPLQK